MSELVNETEERKEKADVEIGRDDERKVNLVSQDGETFEVSANRMGISSVVAEAIVGMV